MLGGGLKAPKEREGGKGRGRGQERFLCTRNPPHLGVLIAAQELSLGGPPLCLPHVLTLSTQPWRPWGPVGK